MNVKTVTNFVVRDETIDAFIKSINKYPVLSPQVEQDLFAKHRAAVEAEKECKGAISLIENQRADEKRDGKEPDPETERARDNAILGYKKQAEEYEKSQIEIRNDIISRNLRFVYAVAKRYSTGDLLPDLINTGILGLYDAFEKYKYETGNRFVTCAVWYIRRAIHAYLNKENLVVRQKNGARITPKVKTIENDFYLRNGRWPSSAEVIDILRDEFGIDADEVDVNGTRVDRIEGYLGDDEENTFEKSPAFNERTADDNAYDSEIEADATRYYLDEAMSTLTEREKTIVSMAYGYGHLKEYKDKEIGEYLGLTSERVRQLRHGAVKKLRSAYLAVSNA